MKTTFFKKCKNLETEKILPSFNLELNFYFRRVEQGHIRKL